ncbi:MAG: TRAP transporter substrate-binding protein, partial [Gammaproteobacteria bacterium]|nr:TRAP transporter substrate-binding protein [Gammaproteobacteria bacterium]
MMRRSVFALGLIAFNFACGSASETIDLKLAHSAAPQSLIALSAQEFARRANERLGDRARIAVFGSGQLGGDAVVLQKLKLGTVDMSLPSTVMSSAVEAFALFEMPYLVRDREHMRRIERDIFWPALAQRAEEEGYKVLAVWENGFRHLTNNTRPIETPGDLRGIKIRTPRSPWRVRVFREFGAQPSPLPFSEVFLALQTGVMDGQENPLSNVVTARFHDVQRYLSLTAHVYSPAYVVVGVERWAELPQDVREILAEVARSTQQFVITAAAALDARLLDELRETGIQINRPDQTSFR